MYKKTNACNEWVPSDIRRELLREYVRRERREYRRHATAFLRAKNDAPRFSEEDARSVIKGIDVSKARLAEKRARGGGGYILSLIHI